MIPEAAAEKMEEARWVAPPEVQAVLDAEVRWLGASGELEAAYRECAFQNEREDRINRLVLFTRLKDYRKNQAVFFKADMPDNGFCRFFMRAAATHDEVAKAPEAKGEWSLNLLRPREEWITGPAIAPPPPPKTDTETTPKKRMLAKGKS